MQTHDYNKPLAPTHANFTGTQVELFTIQAGINDALYITVDFGTEQAVTLDAGVGLTAAQIVADLTLKVVGILAEDIGGSVKISSAEVGLLSGLSLAAGPNTAYATLGFIVGEYLGTVAEALSVDIRNNFQSLSSNHSGTAYPATAWAGMQCFRTDLNAMFIYNGAAWVPVGGTTLDGTLGLGNEATEKGMFLFEDAAKTKLGFGVNVTGGVVGGVPGRTVQVGSSAQNYNLDVIGTVTGKKGRFTEAAPAAVDDILVITNAGAGRDIVGDFWYIDTDGQLNINAYHPGWPFSRTAGTFKLSADTVFLELMHGSTAGMFGIRADWSAPAYRPGAALFLGTNASNPSGGYTARFVKYDTNVPNVGIDGGSRSLQISPASDNIAIFIDGPPSGSRVFKGITGYATLYCIPNPFIEFDAQYGSGVFTRFKGLWYACDGVMNFEPTPRMYSPGTTLSNNYLKMIWAPIYDVDNQLYGGAFIHVRTTTAFAGHTGCTSELRIIDAEFDANTTSDGLIKIRELGTGKILSFGNSGGENYAVDSTGELKIKVYKQNGEPTLTADDFLALWEDTDDSNRVYLLFRRGVADQVAVELT